MCVSVHVDWFNFQYFGVCMLKFNLLNRLFVVTLYFESRMKGCALTLSDWTVEIKLEVGVFQLQFLLCYSLPV